MSQEATAVAYQPAVKVLIHKNVGRSTIDGGVPVSERYKGAARIIDLAPWLGEGAVVRTSKSPREPAGGWSISIPDRMHAVDLDSLYGLVEPMDLIEIRMAHEPHKSPGKLPIVMRGFVSEVREMTTLQGGRPQRSVVLSGQDYGKIWQMLQVFYMPNYPAGENLLTNFKFFAQYGTAFNLMPGSQFVRSVINAVVNPYLADMRSQVGTGAAPSALMGISILDTDLQVSGARDGTVAPFGINQWDGGSVYSLLASFGDVGAFNELFLEDREDGVYLVYRPNPYLSAAGAPLNGNAKPTPTLVPGRDIVSLTVSRSDANVANYFWVESPRFAMNYGSTLRAVAAQGDETSFFLQDYANSNPKLYGIRRMQEVTQQGSPSEQYNGNGTKEADWQKGQQLSADWTTFRRQQLIAQNRDNIVFEQGVVQLRGREDIKAGSYVQIQRGTLSSLYYVASVDHEFQPHVGFFTTLQLERGTGFIERVKREAGKASPYLSELVR